MQRGLVRLFSRLSELITNDYVIKGTVLLRELVSETTKEGDNRYRPDGIHDRRSPEVGEGKTVVLFGSWGWGGGEWMQNWAGQCRELGANLAAEPVICPNQPEEETLAACRELGAALA